MIVISALSCRSPFCRTIPKYLFPADTITSFTVGAGEGLLSCKGTCIVHPPVCAARELYGRFSCCFGNGGSRYQKMGL